MNIKKRVLLTVAVFSFLGMHKTAAYSGGNGTAGSPYLVANKTHLLEVTADMADSSNYGQNIHYKMIADIDLSGQSFTNAIIAPYQSSTTFYGTFDGDGHAIENLTIHATETGWSSTGENTYLGVFGSINGGTVKNLGIENFNIVSDASSAPLVGAGALCGIFMSGSVNNCYSTGSISGTTNGGHVGGLCGYVGNVASTSVNNSHSSVSIVMGEGCSYIGGLIGVAFAHADIQECFSTGSVTVNSGPDDVSSMFVGGLCGGNWGHIQNCYAQGAVSGPGDGLSFGGFCGDNDDGASIVNCYSTGSVSGGTSYSWFGGFSGGFESGSVSGCFWDTQTSGRSTSTSGSGKTTSQMQTQSTFTSPGWNFSSVWQMDGYPHLQWEQAAPQTYVLTVNSGSGDGSYASGTVVSISANAAPSGKVFDQWTGNTAYVANVNASSTTVTMPSAAVSVTAIYKDEPVQTYALTVNSGSGDGSYSSGTLVPIAADVPPNGKVFDQWTGAVLRVVDVNASSTTVIMPSAAISVTATYKDEPVQTYALTVNNGSGDGSYEAGATASISAAAPANGQVFDQWTGDVSFVADVNASSTTVAMPSAAVSLTATYKDEPVATYALTVNNGSGDGSYEAGATVSISAAAPANGQVFDQWTGDVSFVADVNASSTTVAMPSAAASVTATYKGEPVQTYALTVNNGSGDGSYEAGAPVSISAAAPANGQVFDQWTGDVSHVADVNASSTTITMPSASVSVTATYKDEPVQTYALTVNSGSGDGSYEAGATVSISANAAPSGKVFDQWTGNTAYVANVNASSTTVTMPSAAVSVTATYKDEPVQTYALMVNSGSGDGSYEAGTLVPIAADVPPNGKVFDQWTGAVLRVVDVNASSTTVIMPSAAISVTATYKDEPVQTYALTVNSGSGDGSYEAGATVSISANAAPSGKVFDQWTGNTAYVANVNASSTTVTMPSAAVSVTATYENVPTKTLTSVSISGASSVVKGNAGNYSCVATYSDASQSNVTASAVWSVSGSGVSISDAGVLSVSPSAPSASVSVQAEYSEGGITRSGSHAVLIVDAMAYSGGSGTEADPYQIAGKAALLDLASNTDDYDKHFILTADIDLVGEVFTMALIAPDINGARFIGTFNGNGHKIINLTINATGTDNGFLGLFGLISSSSRLINLGIENVNISGGTTNAYCQGALCGFNHHGTIRNCYSTGLNTSSGFRSSHLGGLCGENQGTISECYSSVLVSAGEASSRLGGLCGVNGGVVSKCFASGSVSGGRASEMIGGLCGYNTSGSIIECYSTCSVNSGENSDEVGGLCGRNQGTVSASFWDVELSALAASAGGTGKTTAQMQAQSTFTDTGWDFLGETANGTSETWVMDGYPVFNSLVPFTSWVVNQEVPADLQGDDDAPAADGIPNLLKYACGLSAMQKCNTDDLIIIGDGGGGVFSVDYHKSKSAMDVVLEPMWTPSLTNAWQATGVADSLIGNDSGREMRRASILLGDGGFIRLRATRNP